MELTLEAPRLLLPPGTLAGAPAPGRTALFTGDWLLYDHHGEERYAAAFEGWPLGEWAGGTKWECADPVAIAVMGEQERMRHEVFSELRCQGLPAERAQAEVDKQISPMTWVGTVLVVDETAIGGEVTRIEPNERGRYDPMTWHWCWHEVDPDRVGIDIVHRAR